MQLDFIDPFANVSKYRLLTRAAPIRAATVRERSVGCVEVTRCDTMNPVRP
jgi:hypothetical protein